MIDESRIAIFAYGSNMCTARMLVRVPSANPIAVGYVTGRRIKYHKRSVDGSAKADAEHTGNEADRVWGIVYEIHRDQKADLDRYEQLGVGYGFESVIVDVADERRVRAGIYTALPHAIDQSLQPYSWYVTYLVAGAVQHRLPYCYIQRWLSVPAWLDPDPERHRANAAVVEQSIDAADELK